MLLDTQNSPLLGITLFPFFKYILDIGKTKSNGWNSIAIKKKSESSSSQTSMWTTIKLANICKCAMITNTTWNIWMRSCSYSFHAKFMCGS
jgi:hypothetical protein